MGLHGGLYPGGGFEPKSFFLLTNIWAYIYMAYKRGKDWGGGGVGGGQRGILRYLPTLKHKQIKRRKLT